MKNSNDTIGNRTRDLPACSAVTQLTAPPRARNLRVHYLIHNSKSLFHNLSHNNLTQALPSVFLRPTLILSSHISSYFLISFFPSKFPQQDPLRIFPLPHTCHQLRPSYPPSFDHHCYIWRRLQGKKLLIARVLPSTYYFCHLSITSSTYLSLLPPIYHFFHPTYHLFHPPITSSTPPISYFTPPINTPTHLSLLPPHLPLLPPIYHFFHLTYHCSIHHFFHPPITCSTHLSLLPPHLSLLPPHLSLLPPHLSLISSHLSILLPTYHFFHHTYHSFHPPITSYLMIGTPYHCCVLNFSPSAM